MRDVIAWLESPEGELWSRKHHHTTGPGTLLIGLKEDGICGSVLVGVLWNSGIDEDRISDVA